MVSLPKYSYITSTILVFTCSSTCNTFLSSTYQYIVHYLPSMVLFAMYLPYGLITNPCYFRVFPDRSYHNSVESMQPYRTFNSCRYSTLAAFFIHKVYLCSDLTSDMMSTNSPSVFNMMDFSSSISALRYAPVGSKMDTCIP